MRKLSIYIGRFIVSVLVLLFLLLLLSQTKPFKSMLLNYLIRQTSGLLVNSELSIESLEGTLYTNAKLHGIHLIHENQDTLVSLDELSVSYKLLPLLKKELVLNHIRFKNPSLTVKIHEDGSWNMTDIIPIREDTTESITRQDDAIPLLNTIILTEFVLESGKISLNNINAPITIPAEIRELNISGSVHMKGDSIRADFTTFRFRTVNPEFVLKNMSFQFMQKSNLSRNLSLMIQTALSQVQGMTETDTLEPFPLFASLEANPLFLEEFQDFIPEDFPLITLPKISFSLSSIRDKGNLKVKITHDDQLIQANVQTLTLTPEPVYTADLTVKRLNLSTWLKDYPVESDLNLSLKAEGKGLDPKKLRLHMTTEFEQSEINGYKIDPGNLEFKKNLEELSFTLNYLSAFGDVHLTGKLDSLFNIPLYNISGRIKNLDPSKLLPQSFPESDINLSFRAKGRGFTYDDIKTSVRIECYQSHIGEILIDTIDFSFDYENERLLVRSGILSNSLLSLKLSGYADLKGKTDIHVTIKPGNLNQLSSFIDIAPVTASGIIYGHITGQFPDFILKTQLQLHDISYDELFLENASGILNIQYKDSLYSGDLDLSLNSLRINPLNLDQIRIRSKGHQKELFNILTVNSKDINLYLETNVITDSVLALHIPDLNLQFGPYNVKTTHKEGKIFWDSQSLYIDNMALKAADSDIRVHGLFNPDIDGFNDFDIHILNFSLDVLDTLHLIPYPLKGYTSLKIQGQGLRQNPRLSILSEIRHIELDGSSPANLDLGIELNNQISDVYVKYAITPNEIIEGTFTLPVILDPYPVIPREDSLKATIKTTQLNMSHLNAYDVSPYSFNGLISASAALSGILKNPVVMLEAKGESVTIDDFSLNHISFHADLADSRLKSSFIIEKTVKEKLTGTASIPLNLFAGEEKQRIPQDEPLSIDLSVKDLDLAFLEQFSEAVRNLRGLLNIDLHMRNTLTEPRLNGEITLNKGSLAIPRYGLEYTDIGLKAGFVDREMRLNELVIKGGDGKLTVNGLGVLAQPITGGIDNYTLKAKGDNFTLAGSKDIFLLADMDLGLQGTPETSEYNGKIRLSKGRLNLDALKRFSEGSYDANAPMLVQAGKEVLDTTTIIHKVQSPDFVKNLTGRLTVTIPRNTWIRNKNMNIELDGNLDVLKNDRYFEIFGTIRTLRGFYEQYGRKFNIDEGSITFDGSSEMNPVLNFTVTHFFRDMNRIRKKLSIKLTGRLNNPSISFLLNGEEISEVDAVSYLLFGKSSQEITQNEQSEVNRQTETGLAKSLIARQLGTQLTGEIGKRLELDVFEFSGGEDWKQASIFIGKYITDRLFLSYEKDFVIGQTREIVPDKVSAEYELNRNILIQATRGDERTSGFDIFWKFNKR
jgi:hypothetical protein